LDTDFKEQAQKTAQFNNKLLSHQETFESEQSDFSKNKSIETFVWGLQTGNRDSTPNQQRGFKSIDKYKVKS